MSDLKTLNCTNCGSHKVRYDAEFGFYKCESCSTVWARDEDDPDWDELVEGEWRELHQAFKVKYPDKTA